MWLFWSSLSFYIILILSVMFQISSLSWFSLWVGMELNLLSFIPLLYNNKNILFNEGAMKYFLIQAFGSVIFLVGWIMSSTIFYGQVFYMSCSEFFFFISLGLKLGVVPFHFWFPVIMENMDWSNAFLLMTLQKLGLLIMISYISSMIYFFIISSIFSSIVGGFGGFNQISIRKIFAYSSIGHLGWLMMSLIINEWSFLMYYSFYFLMMFLFSMIFYLNMIMSINQLMFYCESFLYEKLIIMLSLLSLGGLPPLSGFFVKWMVLNSLLSMNLKFLSFILVMMTLVNLYYYIRLSYSTFMFSSSSMFYLVFNLKFINVFLVNLIVMIKFLSLIFIPLSIWLM